MSLVVLAFAPNIGFKSRFSYKATIEDLAFTFKVCIYLKLNFLNIDLKMGEGIALAQTKDIGESAIHR